MLIFLNILKQFFISSIGTLGFAILFGIPSNAIFQSAFIGGVGWTFNYLFSQHFNSLISGAFFGALAVGVIGEAFARYYKKPATVFIIPGIIPLVPGSGMYYTMAALVENNFQNALNKGVETFFIATAISVGIIITTSLSRSINRAKFDRLTKN